jgi:hypothetical protein
MSEDYLTTICVVLNNGTPAEHNIRIATVNLQPEDERMQELLETRDFYEVLVESLKAWGENVGEKSDFVFDVATEEEREDWQEGRIGSSEEVYVLGYVYRPVEKTGLN